jgi:hypothetical protein
MSTLQKFLNTNPIDGLTEEVPISERFKDEKGKLLKFKIRVMSSVELGEYRKKAMKVNPKSKNKVEVDANQLTSAIVINHTVDPNFKDAESIKEMGCSTPEAYLNKVLLPGEIDDLSERIQSLSGFNKSMDDLVEEAKN